MIEVWIYFLFLEFWPSVGIGTLASLLGIPEHPQDIVFSCGPFKKLTSNKAKKQRINRAFFIFN